jgi:hypothetical protein
VAIEDNICVGDLPTTLGAPVSILSDQNEYPVPPPLSLSLSTSFDNDKMSAYGAVPPDKGLGKGRST